jgi:hypothetical protein
MKFDGYQMKKYNNVQFKFNQKVTLTLKEAEAKTRENG